MLCMSQLLVNWRARKQTRNVLRRKMWGRENRTVQTNVPSTRRRNGYGKRRRLPKTLSEFRVKNIKVLIEQVSKIIHSMMVSHVDGLIFSKKILIRHFQVCFDKLRQYIPEVSHQDHPLEWIRCNTAQVKNLTRLLLGNELPIGNIYPVSCTSRPFGLYRF